MLFNLDEASLTIEEYVKRAKQNEKIINKEATRFNQNFSQTLKQVIFKYNKKNLIFNRVCIKCLFDN